VVLYGMYGVVAAAAAAAAVLLVSFERINGPLHAKRHAPLVPHWLRFAGQAMLRPPARRPPPWPLLLLLLLLGFAR
jgi:hypothetical protein